MKKWLSCALAFVLLLTGCSVKEEKDIPARQQSNSVNTHNNDNVLTVGFGLEVYNLNPIHGEGLGVVAMGLCYDTLIRYEHGVLEPGLAERWEVSDDGKDITLFLRQGVFFHDGEVFDSSAVKQNLEYFKTVPFFSWLHGISGIDHIDIINENTITLHYTDPYYAALYDLASPSQTAIVSPKLLENATPTEMNGCVGTGPFKVASFEEGRETILERNEEYWGEKPEWTQIVMKYIPSSSSRLKALQIGEVDMLFSTNYITYDDYEQATSMPGIQGQISEETTKTRNILLNASTPILKDQKVREAIMLAFLPEDITTHIMYGHEEVANAIFNPTLPYCNVKLEEWEKNREKAKAYLEEAGWHLQEGQQYRMKDGKECLLSMSYIESRSLDKEISEAFQAQMKDIGIHVEIQGYEMMTWYATNMNGDFSVTIANTNGTPYDPQNTINPMLDSTADSIAMKDLSDVGEFQKWLVQSKKTANVEEVQELYNKMLQYLNNHVIHVPVSYQKEVVLYREDQIESIAFGGSPNIFFPAGIKGKH